jgi:hypothetical protein
MADANAIAAATAILQRLLKEGIPRQDPQLAQVDVTSQPPDKVNATVDRATLNVFLYRVATTPMLRQRPPARGSPSPTALTLEYLLTAHGRVDQHAGDLSHRVLGAAMCVLQSTPVIATDERDRLLPAGARLTQPHSLRVTPIEMSRGDMATIWTMFRTSYRLSIACEVELLATPNEDVPFAATSAIATASSDDFARALREFGLDAESTEAMYQLKAGLAAAPSAAGLRGLFCGSDPQRLVRAAQLLATTDHRDVHRIDLAQISERYIGETEKQLARLFDKAESSGAILFFDEADALFGKRSDRGSAHDRYANIEVSYLLKRFDAHAGPVLLTTARKAALDLAVLRRFRTVVEFARD